jgi:hypothetical protein
MLAAGFAGPRRRVVAGERVVERSEDEIVASVFSMSGSAPHLFGSRVAEFEQDLREIVRGASPAGQFCEVSETVQLIVWTRPGDD